LVVGEGPGEAKRGRGRPRREPGAAAHRRGCEQIGFADAANFSEALNFARAIGMEPNLWVTVQWRHAESPRPPAERVQRLLNLIGVFIRRRAGLPPVWAYAREVGKLKGEHLHLLVYVPPAHQKEFRGKLRDWIALEPMAIGGDLKQSALDVQVVEEGSIHRLKTYCLKEGTDEVRQAFWVPDTARYRRTGGVIAGKRVKVSHSINRRARQLAAGPA